MFPPDGLCCCTISRHTGSRAIRNWSGKLKRKSKTGILEHYRAEYISLIHIYKFYSIKKIFVLSFTLDFS